MVRLSDIPALCHDVKSRRPRWYYVHRWISTPITWLLYHCHVSANAVSASMVLLGCAGAAAQAVPSLRVNLLGLAVMYFAFLLDKVDGDLSRLQGSRSPDGMILDYA